MTEAALQDPVVFAIEADSFTYRDEDDGYLYHVTSENNVESILSDGFSSSKKMFGASYHGHSEGRAFFTEKSGVMFWKSRVEDQLFDKHDDPPEVAVLRIPKSLVQSHLQVDEPGTTDSKHNAYFIDSETLNFALSAPSTVEKAQPSMSGLDDSFDRWFEGSKVTNQSGAPKLLFHGTDVSFDEFDCNEGWFGSGIYFTDDPVVAAEYADTEDGGNIIPVFLNLQNPYFFTEEDSAVAGNVQLMFAIGFEESEIQRSLRDGSCAQLITERLVEDGYDGIIARQLDDPVEYIAFEPDQVKFAALRDWIAQPAALVKRSPAASF